MFLHRKKMDEHVKPSKTYSITDWTILPCHPHLWMSTSCYTCQGLGWGLVRSIWRRWLFHWIHVFHGFLVKHSLAITKSVILIQAACALRLYTPDSSTCSNMYKQLLYQNLSEFADERDLMKCVCVFTWT